MATRWKPDTCDCVLDVIDWDTDQATTIATCPQHAGLTGTAHMLVVYRGENQVKNLALGDIEAVAPGKSESARWAFDAAPVGQARAVSFVVQNLTPSERAQIGQRHAKYGAGKARLT